MENQEGNMHEKKKIADITNLKGIQKIRDLKL